MHEVSRLRPVLPLGVPHGTTCAVKLDRWRLPEKCMVMPLHWYINRDPALWKRPDEFLPDRFLDEFGGLQVPQHFMSFQVTQATVDSDGYSGSDSSDAMLHQRN